MADKNQAKLTPAPRARMSDGNAYTALQRAESIGPDPEGLTGVEVLRGEMPLDPSMVKALGRPIAELLGAIFRTPTGSGLPAKLRVTNWDYRKGQAMLHGLRKGDPPFAVSPDDLSTLIDDGTVALDEPPQGAVDAIRKKLAAHLK